MYYEVTPSVTFSLPHILGVLQYSDLKKIRALLAKAFNQKKYYAKQTNNNLRTSSASTSANKKPEYEKSKEKKNAKKEDGKKRDMSKESLSSAEETIAGVSYYSSDSKSDFEYETSDYYDKTETTYGLFVDNDDDQETSHDAIKLASNFLMKIMLYLKKIIMSHKLIIMNLKTKII
ncbi:hypothetical protein Tco_0522446 [Tanacetum coccineum]